MSVRQDPEMLTRVHKVSEALAELQVHLLTSRDGVPTSGAEAYALDSILEATDSLRAAFDHFVTAAVAAQTA